MKIWSPKCTDFIGSSLHKGFLSPLAGLQWMLPPGVHLHWGCSAEHSGITWARDAAQVLFTDLRKEMQCRCTCNTEENPCAAFYHTAMTGLLQVIMSCLWGLWWTVFGARDPSTPVRGKQFLSTNHHRLGLTCYTLVCQEFTQDSDAFWGCDCCTRPEPAGSLCFTEDCVIMQIKTRLTCPT